MKNLNNFKNDITNLNVKDLEMLVWILSNIQSNPKTALAKYINKWDTETQRLDKVKRAIGRTLREKEVA